MKNVILTCILALTIVAATSAVAPLASQEQPADNTQIMLDKVKADKKLVVAENMELTESEAAAFWPVYEQYQKELGAINERLRTLIAGYAQSYNTDTVTDEKAKKMTDEMIAIEKDYAAFRASFVPKLGAVLPPMKVVRYLQIENKIRALIMLALADEVPLVM
jgi:Spy/CpxP family protein refolding chaperone